MNNTPPKGYEYWDEGPEDYPLEDWRYQVKCGDTRQGYWEWVKANLEEARAGKRRDEAK